MAFESVGPFLRRLALIAVGLSAGDAGGVAGALEEIPERALLQALQSDDDAGEEDQRVLVLELLALDARPVVRAAVAGECAIGVARCAGGWPRRTALLHRLARDPSPHVRDAAATGLGHLLRASVEDGSDPWARVEIIAVWADDLDPRVRLALARALPAAPFVVGARTALDALLEDPSPPVRAEAARAARRSRLG